MSEYSEKHSISKMIGTAPGYIGYGEGGNLTEKVKHNPYSIILFDEIEKAHPEVFNVFLQLLDEGRMTDGEGTTVDFTNCIIVMTSNAGYGAEKLYGGRIGFTELNDNTVDAEKIAMNALKSTFKPEFLNRLDNIVVFNKLTKEQSKSITKLSLDKLSARVLKSNNITIKFNKSVIDNIAEAGFSDEYGARNINREIQNRLEDNIADAILSVEIKSGDTASVSIKNNNVIIKKVEEDK
jgi:ATP-dependent Clp protease ATP-binding subunit ClpC